jgi:hypothetical protein
MNPMPTSGIAYLAPQSYEDAINRFSPEEKNRMYAEHRRQFPPPRPSATLWKYLDHYKFEHLLSSKDLFLCQVERLGIAEPNEGRMNELQEEALLKHCEDDHEQLENFRAFHTRIRQHSWVTCFSLGDFDDSYMWENYCRKSPNEGVAIETSGKMLRQCIAALTLPPHAQVSIAMVRYKDSHYMPWNMEYLLFQKRSAFIREHEVRLCVMSFEEEPKKSLPLRVDLSKLIRRIHIHPNASEEYRVRVDALVAKHLPSSFQRRVRFSRLWKDTV